MQVNVTAILLSTIGAGVLVLGARMMLRRHERGRLPLYIEGLGKIAYNSDVMDRTSAKEIADELFAVKRRIWPELLAVYQTGIEYGIGLIIIDPKFFDPRHGGGIKVVPNIGILTINPTTEWEHGDYRNAFAGELASMIRYQLFGQDYVYKSIDEEDAGRRSAAAVLWKSI